jgi:chemotaxis regulatin CheY-phosphate phosphatase CheZ
MDGKRLASISLKINELRALYMFGQRVIPFLEELFQFVQDVIPILNEVNQSINESTEKFPRAATQLSKVTEATEVAATEIFDTVDIILHKLAKMRSQHTTHVEAIKKVVRIDSHMIRLLREELTGVNDDLLEQLNQMHLEKLRVHKQIIEVYDQIHSTLDEIYDDTNSIMMSMQVQDITSQQIAAVNHLINSVEDRLMRLVEKIQGNAPKEGASPNLSDVPLTFDPNADYNTSGESQKFTDAILANFNTPKSEEDIATQDEIDKLFSSGARKADTSPADDPNSAKPQNTTNQSEETVSQDELNKLFKNM